MFAIAAQTDQQLPRAQALAKRLNVPLVSEGSVDIEYLLVVTEQRLELRQAGQKQLKPFYIDFLSDALSYRLKQGGGRRQAIAKAVGLKHGWCPSVLDATAGLGRDACVLAHLGCDVLMIERSPLVAALLEDALLRAKDSLDFSLQFKCIDAIQYMNNCEQKEKREVVYLDPMFPHRSKSALVKKEMQILQTLLGHDNDGGALLASALDFATKRVVVKRPAWADHIDDRAPSMSIKTKQHRFDVYLI